MAFGRCQKFSTFSIFLASSRAKLRKLKKPKSKDFLGHTDQTSKILQGVESKTTLNFRAIQVDFESIYFYEKNGSKSDLKNIVKFL